MDKYASAHAHHSGGMAGMICTNDKRNLKNNELILHEVAHIIVGKEAPKYKRIMDGHNKVWAKILVDIGGTLDEYISYDSNGKEGYSFDYNYLLKSYTVWERMKHIVLGREKSEYELFYEKITNGDK